MLCNTFPAFANLNFEFPVGIYYICGLVRKNTKTSRCIGKSYESFMEIKLNEIIDKLPFEQMAESYVQYEKYKAKFSEWDKDTKEKLERGNIREHQEGNRISGSYRHRVCVCSDISRKRIRGTAG
jgi:hypothetical protein